MKVIVQLFAEARDRVGTPTAVLELPSAATVADLRAVLAERFPALGKLLTVSRIAVSHEFADDSDPIPSGAEVAVIPPVSGG